MKTLNQDELKQVTGGASWGKFRELLKDGFDTLGDALSEAAANIRSDWRAARDAIRNNK